MDAFWPTLKSERPRSDFGANQYKELGYLKRISRDCCRVVVNRLGPGVGDLELEAVAHPLVNI